MFCLPGNPEPTSLIFLLNQWLMYSLQSISPTEGVNSSSKITRSMGAAGIWRHQDSEQTAPTVCWNATITEIVSPPRGALTVISGFQSAMKSQMDGESARSEEHCHQHAQNQHSLLLWPVQGCTKGPCPAAGRGVVYPPQRRKPLPDFYFFVAGTQTLN